MTVEELIHKISTAPEAVDFTEVITTIDDAYQYTPARFSNGTGSKRVINEAGSNEGSCKILAFARLNELTEQQTLNCFANYYREDVLQHPDNDDHANIRNFMLSGWEGIEFESEALLPREGRQQAAPCWRLQGPVKRCLFPCSMKATTQ